MYSLKLEHPFKQAGGLAFDEVKIQRGIVWDAKTNRFVGFADTTVLTTEAAVGAAL